MTTTVILCCSPAHTDYRDLKYADCLPGLILTSQDSCHFSRDSTRFLISRELRSESWADLGRYRYISLDRDPMSPSTFASQHRELAQFLQPPTRLPKMGKAWVVARHPHGFLTFTLIAYKPEAMGRRSSSRVPLGTVDLQVANECGETGDTESQAAGFRD